MADREEREALRAQVNAQREAFYRAAAKRAEVDANRAAASRAFARDAAGWRSLKREQFPN